MKHLYVITIFCCWLISCSKDRVDEYGDTSYVFLANGDKEHDTLVVKPVEYSFAFHPGADIDTVPVFIRLVGKLSDQDRVIPLIVDASQTTAASGDYELPNPIVLRAGHAIDTIPLTLHRTARLKTAKFKIRLMLSENENFRPGPPGNRYIDITFSDMIAKPGWWTQTVESNFLAKYSDTKYRLFIEATGIADMTGLPETEQRAYAIIFRDFLARGRENGEVYEDEYGQVNVSPNLF